MSSTRMHKLIQNPPRASLAVFTVSVVALAVSVAGLEFAQMPRDRRVSVIALSGTGHWIAAGSASGNINVLDLWRGGSPKQVSFPHGILNDLRFSPDEHLLAIASRDLGLYAFEKAGALRIVRGDGRNYGTVRFDAGGTLLLVVTSAGRIETIDIDSASLRLDICCSSVYGEVAFTPDGHAIANAGHWPALWDARSGALLGRLTANRQFETFRPIGFDQRRNIVMMGSQDGRVYAWDIYSKQLLARSGAQPGYVDTLGVFNSGWVAFAGFGANIRLWEPASGHERLWPEARPASNLVLTPDGASVVFGTAGGFIEYWDIRTERLTRRIAVNQ